MNNTEKFPDNLIYIRDTPTNRELIKSILGEAKLEIPMEAYIVINQDTKEWETTFVFEWLYRNAPPHILLDKSNNFEDLIKKAIEAREEYKIKHKQQ